MLTLSPLGSGALLLDAAGESFSDEIQHRVWATASQARHLQGVRETVPGMNNLLVTFDALAVTWTRVAEALRAVWAAVEPDVVQGKTVDVPVHYGGTGGEDLVAWATHCGLTVEDAVRRHAAAVYTVAAVGAMPGFPYLAGLDPALAQPRRASPRAVVPRGSVIIGGAQAAIMPQTAPSGWHILGRTTLTLFDACAEPPSLLQPGDMVHFTIAGIDA